MCGICGIFEHERYEPFPRQVVDRMNQTIIHRGPDDDGVYLGEGAGFGFRRLSIIDVAGGHQPISNEDGTLWVMLTGASRYSEGARSCLIGMSDAVTILLSESAGKIFPWISGNGTGDTAKTESIFIPVCLSVFSARSRASATALSHS